MSLVKKEILKNKKIMKFAFLTGLLVFVFGVYQVLYLRKAHSTFENYYAFRGCTELLEKTQDYGICKTNTGQNIKLVKFDNRWFLDGDLPCGLLCF